MDTGYYKFYEKKSKIFVFLLLCILFTAGCYWGYIGDTDIIRKFFLVLVMPLFGFGSIVFFIKLLSNKPYIEITPDYIKIGGFDKCLWGDIIGITTSCNKENFFLHVKDVSKYKLTFLQKVNSFHGSSPFYIASQAISEKDKEELKRILKERISQNNLE